VLITSPGVLDSFTSTYLISLTEGC
jgi:hypothetical protein